MPSTLLISASHGKEFPNKSLQANEVVVTYLQKYYIFNNSLLDNSKYQYRLTRHEKRVCVPSEYF